MKQKIKIGDTVYIDAGKDRRKVGQIIKIFPDRQKAEVQGINILKKHTKASKKYPKGGIIDINFPVHISNLRLICQACQKITQAKIKTVENNLQRICLKCHQNVRVEQKKDEK